MRREGRCNTEEKETTGRWDGMRGVRRGMTTQKVGWKECGKYCRTEGDESVSYITVQLA